MKAALIQLITRKLVATVYTLEVQGARHQFPVQNRPFKFFLSSHIHNKLVEVPVLVNNVALFYLAVSIDER
jgi:hypothetical protein